MALKDKVSIANVESSVFTTSINDFEPDKDSIIMSTNNSASLNALQDNSLNLSFNSTTVRCKSKSSLILDFSFMCDTSLNNLQSWLLSNYSSSRNIKSYIVKFLDMYPDFDKKVQEYELKLNEVDDESRDALLSEYESYKKDCQRQYKANIKKCAKLNKSNIDRYKQNGIDTLYFGLYFISGSRDRHIINAPLFLVPAKLLKMKDYIEVTINQDKEVCINRPLLILLRNIFGLDINIDIDIQDLNLASSEAVIKFILNDIFKGNPVIVDVFKDIEKINDKDSGNLKLNLYNALCLGLFGLSTSIYDDYEALKTRRMNNSINKLINGEDADISDASAVLMAKSKLYNTPRLGLISVLDSSQEMAVYTASKSKYTVIYGPPGTGKSQVLTNIVSDYLSKGKSVLVVSEKKTALDVIYKRLRILSKFALLLTDSNDNTAFIKYLDTFLALDNVTPSHDVYDYDICVDNLRKMSSLQDYLSKDLAVIEKPLSFLYSNCTEYSNKVDSLALILSYTYQDIVNTSYDTLVRYFDVLNKDNYVSVYKVLREKDFSCLYNLSELQIKSIILNKSKLGDLDKQLNLLLGSIKDECNNLSCDDLKRNKSDYSDYINLCGQILFNCEQSEFDISLDSNYITDNITSVTNNLSDIKLYVDDYIANYSSIINNDINKYLTNDKEIINYENELNSILVVLNSCDTSIVGVANKYVNLSSFDLDTIKRLIDLCNSAFSVYNEFKSQGISITNCNDCNTLFVDNVRKKYEKIVNNVKIALNSYNITSLGICSDLSESEINIILTNLNDYTFKKNKLFKNYAKLNNENYLKLQYILNYYNTLAQSEVQQYNDRFSIFRNCILCINDLLGEEFIIYSNVFIESINYLYYTAVLELKHRNDDLTMKLSNRKLTLRATISSLQDYFAKQLTALGFCTINDLCNSVFYLKNYYELQLKNIDNLIEKYNSIQEKINTINIDKSNINELISNTLTDSSITSDDLQYYLDNINYIKVVNNFNGVQKGILDLNNQGYSTKDILNAYCRVYIDKASDISKLETIYDYDSKINEIINIEDNKVDINIKEIYNKLYAFINNKLTSNDINLNKIQLDLARKGKKKQSIRQVLSKNPSLLSLFRICLCTPDVVSDILPLQSDLFDIVIIDEASQMYLYNAIPAIYRGSRVVVSGDDKQLKPTAFFKLASSEDDDSVEDTDIDTVDKNISLLDQAKINFNSVSLMFHYRAKYCELIQFSNYAFYNNTLKLAPNIVRPNQGYKPIEFIKVNGKRENSINKYDAIKTVELLKQLMHQSNDTIGIITLNSRQKDCILDLIDDLQAEDSDFARDLAFFSNRTIDDEDVSLFVKSIEEVQGDERDRIIICLGLGLDLNNKVSLTQLGPIIKSGGANRLNVMLSRAKFKEYIVSSIEFSDVDISGSTSDGSRFFRQFLEYAQSISSGNYDAIKYIFDTTNPSQDQFDSPFEEQVCTQLRQLGYTVETQVGVRGYRIDMAVYDNELGRYIAGIECDGATYHSREDVREHDVIRQRFLESRGWTILRIWSTNWWKNSNSELSRIDSKLKELRELLLSVKQDIVEDIQESRAVVQIEDTNNTGLEDAELDTPNISDSQKLNISLLDKSDITGTKPVAVIIDDCFYDVKSWWDILSTLLIHVLKKDSTITDAEIIPVVGSLKANMSECRKPQQLLWGRNLYLERNQSSIGAFTGIKQVLNKYNCKVEVVMK